MRLTTGQELLPFRIRVQNFTGPDGSAFRTFRCIITEAGVKQAGNFQMLHSISDFIHVYVFGDRIGELVVSGICFGSFCGDAPGTPSGIEMAMSYSRNNRLGARGTPALIAVGGSANAAIFVAFLVGGEMKVINPETPVGQFAWQFNIISSSGAF